MTDISHHSGVQLSDAEKSRVIVGLLAGLAIWFGAFLSGFVIAEPAPYELFLAIVIPVWAIFGLRIPRSILPLIALLVLFNVGGIVSMMTMQDWSGARIYVAVSFFLAATAIFFAAIIAANPARLKLLFSGYLAAALITGSLGILGYFGLVPGAELFTLFDRAKGAFEDPNVYAPFLCLPAIWCLYQLLHKPLVRATPELLMFLVLALGLFLSFSRAGWGLFILSSVLMVFCSLIGNPSGKFRVRVVVLSIVTFVCLVLAVLVALQFEQVRDLFVDRAQLVQDYDSARLGRFARQAIGFQLATESPFGIGILEFGRLYGEDPHNIWLKALLDYSWLGFAAYVVLIIWTLFAGLKILFRNRPWQPYLLCTYIVFFGHIVLGTVIDTDHWRHFFVLLGIIWGCIGAEIVFRGERPQTVQN